MNKFEHLLFVTYIRRAHSEKNENEREDVSPMYTRKRWTVWIEIERYQYTIW